MRRVAWFATGLLWVFALLSLEWGDGLPRWVDGIATGGSAPRQIRGSTTLGEHGANVPFQRMKTVTPVPSAPTPAIGASASIVVSRDQSATAVNRGVEIAPTELGPSIMTHSNHESASEQSAALMKQDSQVEESISKTFTMLNSRKNSASSVKQVGRQSIAQNNLADSTLAPSTARAVVTERVREAKLTGEESIPEVTSTPNSTSSRNELASDQDARAADRLSIARADLVDSTLAPIRTATTQHLLLPTLNADGNIPELVSAPNSVIDGKELARHQNATTADRVSIGQSELVESTLAPTTARATATEHVLEPILSAEESIPEPASAPNAAATEHSATVIGPNFIPGERIDQGASIWGSGLIAPALSASEVQNIQNNRAADPDTQNTPPLTVTNTPAIEYSSAQPGQEIDTKRDEGAPAVDLWLSKPVARRGAASDENFTATPAMPAENQDADDTKTTLARALSTLASSASTAAAGKLTTIHHDERGLAQTKPEIKLLLGMGAKSNSGFTPSWAAEFPDAIDAIKASPRDTFAEQSHQTINNAQRSQDRAWDAEATILQRTAVQSLPPPFGDLTSSAAEAAFKTAASAVGAPIAYDPPESLSSARTPNVTGDLELQSGSTDGSASFEYLTEQVVPHVEPNKAAATSSDTSTIYAQANAPGPTNAVVTAVTDREIRFGIAAPFSGPAKELGRQMKIGIETVFNLVNEKGGIYGRQLKLFSADDGYEPSRTGEAMRQLRESDHIFGLIGNVGTPTAAVALPLALEHRMLFFAPFTGANLLRAVPPDHYVFNYRASYSEETEAAVRYLVRVRGIQPREIAVFAQQDAYGDAGYEGVARAVRALRGSYTEPVLRLNYKRNTVDVSDAVSNLRLRKGKIKAVVMIPTYRAAANFIEKTRDLYPNLIYTNVSFVGSTALADELVLQGSRFADGVIITQVVPAVNGYSKTVLDYRAALARYFPGEMPDYVSLEGYIATRLLVEALKKAGPQLDTEKLIDALESLHGLDMGLGTLLNFSPSEHQASHKVWGTQLDGEGHFKAIDLD